FLFTGDDVYKQVRDLSGGEKGRLALAKLIYSRVNVLVLDEPTNHLDIPSREALEEALSAYEGTIVTISHDRYFLDRVATQILALDGVGGAEHYDGDYTEYHDWKLGRRETAYEAVKPAEPDNLVSVVATPAAVPEPVISKPTPAPKKHGVKVVKKKKPETRTPELVETDIARAEQRLNEISEQMGTPEVARDADRLIALNGEYQQTEALLRTLYEEWDRVSQELARTSG
ncbi:MAG TPA: ATP-binding cassette domain-containing protein, partial [Pyrinomonadaceae bacterium]